MKNLFILLFIFFVQFVFGQAQLAPLTVEKIMRDPKWIGTSPSNPYWSADGRYLFFSWNPEGAISDSVYYISLANAQPKKTNYAFRLENPGMPSITYNSTYTSFVYVAGGDVYYRETRSNKTVRITQTVEAETNPQFILKDNWIVFTRGSNLFAWDITTGSNIQLTNFQNELPKQLSSGPQEKWLQQQQLKTSEILKTRKDRKDSADAASKVLTSERPLRTIYIDNKNLNELTISPNGRFVTYRLSKSAQGTQNTIVPNYVTESGFTTNIAGRTKVGAPEEPGEFFIFDRERDTVIVLKTEQIPGIQDMADYVKDYSAKDTSIKKNGLRSVTVYGPIWNNSGSNAVVEIRANDHKDRWLMLLDASTGKLKLLDRLRDEAWVGGPGFNSLFTKKDSVWIDENNFWYQSEETGYAHLYTFNILTGEKKNLTRGNYEVQGALLSRNKKYFYITTNEVHPGEQHFYRLGLNSGRLERITNMTGASQVIVSPDEKHIAILYSAANKPWELYLQENKAGGRLIQITNKAQSEEFKSYEWRQPDVINFTASDSSLVYARLYRPANPHPAKPAVIFVHGAGYLQNAHKWWSQYFREYMFNNLLADKGYTVLDIDYRGSAGYGRDWRTGIYRFMGGKDLSDHVDGAKYLVEKCGIDPKRIGIYGGSYGGFITLMGMFQHPETFAAGAALRSVTDWAHYNHGYTSNILNEPFNDSLAYARSSPIYFADGLKGHLLMCHGMIDVNVHFQDIVRLTQRLIELKKENWELAVYPLEDHAFIEPTSWMDEYKRILKLFEAVLKK